MVVVIRIMMASVVVIIIIITILTIIITIVVAIAAALVQGRAGIQVKIGGYRCATGPDSTNQHVLSVAVPLPQTI